MIDSIKENINREIVSDKPLDGEAAVKRLGYLLLEARKVTDELNVLKEKREGYLKEIRTIIPNMRMVK